MTTVDRLRSDIDSGRTGDKVAASDPAAAPLGTDEEAAGTPLSLEAVELARAREVARPPREQRDGGVLAYTIAIAGMMTIMTAGALYFLGGT